MLFGMQHEYTRLIRERGTRPCKGDGALNLATLSTLLNNKETSHKSRIEALVNELRHNGMRSNLVYTAQDDPDSEFGKITNCYFTVTDYNKVCAKAILSPSGMGYNIVDAFPVFDSTRRYQVDTPCSCYSSGVV